MTIVYASIGLFALAAVTGLLVLIKWLTNKTASKSVIYTHGIFAAIALILLIAFAVSNPENIPAASLSLFILSACIGFYMFFRDLKNKMTPTMVAVLHALGAVAGFIALLFFAFA